MKSDAIFGYYLHNNFGDDLFAATLTTKLCREEWGSPKTIYNFDDLNAIRSTGFSPEQVSLSRATRYLRNLSLLNSARTITLGGGSVIGTYKIGSIRQLQVFKRNILKIPLSAIGVGLEGQDNKSRRQLLSEFDWIALRTERDYKEARCIRMPKETLLMPDIAYASADIFEYVSRQEDCIKCITLIPAAVGHLGKTLRMPGVTRNWLRHEIYPFAEKHGFQIRIYVLQNGNLADIRLSKELESLILADNVCVSYHLHESARRTYVDIARSALVISDRLHGAVVAHAQGRPFSLSNHHRKCIEFNQSVYGSEAGAVFNLIDQAEMERRMVLQALPNIQNKIVNQVSIANESIEAWVHFLKSTL